MKKLIFFFIFLAQVVCYANPKAKKLINLYFPEAVLTETFVAGFIKDKSEAQLKNYNINPAAFRRLVKSNYTHILLRDAADTISHFKDPELDQIMAFLNSPAGRKVREIQLKKPAKPVTELLTKEELQASERFYQSYAGVMWDTALKRILERMKDPKSKPARTTVRVLHEFLNQKNVTPEGRTS